MNETLTISSSEHRELGQGWTVSDRETFYHTDEGSQLIDYGFFKNLEQANSKNLLSSPNFFRKLNLFPSEFHGPNSKNPDNLPIGLAINEYQNESRPEWSGRWIGISCASCHTNVLNYNGRSLRIDGGSGSFDLYGLIIHTNNSVERTIQNKEKLKRFINRLNNDPDIAPQFKNLSTNEAKRHLKERSRKIRFIAKTSKGRRNHWGYGRMDVAALTLNAITAYGLKISKNAKPTKNPSKIPPLWYSNDFYQHHNVGLTVSPIRRNSIQAIGGGASIDLTSPAGKGLFESNLPLENLNILENKVSKLRAPNWPEDIFGSIDLKKARKGKDLYKKHCLECHGGHPADRYQEVTEKFPFNQKALIPFNRYRSFRIGTDSKHAKFFFAFAKTGQLTDHLYDVTPFPFKLTLKLKRAPNAVILTGLANSIVDYGLEKIGITPDCNGSSDCIGGYNKKWLEFEGYRDPKERINPLLLQNALKNFLTYRAPQLAGVWATPPYLHNASVPTLFELLSPLKERRKSFYLGANEYDPKKLGFASDSNIAGNDFKVDTRLKGNSHKGHLFQNERGNGIIGPYLKPVERFQILEYLKTNLK